ncbi:MAG: InlB B-repeat-containing protein [Treponema sp.]
MNGAPDQTNADAYKAQIVSDSNSATAPANPVWTGYQFRHWSKASGGSEAETACTITNTPVTEDMTLYAIWKLIPKKHTIHFNLNNGSGTAPEDQQIEHGQKVTKPTDEEVKKMNPPAGHHFKHWSKENNHTVGTKYTDTITESLTLESHKVGHHL